MKSLEDYSSPGWQIAKWLKGSDVISEMWRAKRNMSPRSRVIDTWKSFLTATCAFMPWWRIRAAPILQTCPCELSPRSAILQNDRKGATLPLAGLGGSMHRPSESRFKYCKYMSEKHFAASVPPPSSRLQFQTTLPASSQDSSSPLRSWSPPPCSPKCFPSWVTFFL